MIDSTQPDTAPYTPNSLMSAWGEFQVLPSLTEENTIDFCICNSECEFREKVFGKTGGEPHENDIRSFIYLKLIPSDVIEIKLYKNNEEVAVLNDNTYGTFYDFGDFVTRPEYKGYLLDFGKVLDSKGSGVYHVKAKGTITGSPYESVSQKFLLNAFSEIAAHGTALMEWYQDGNILSSLFDFTGLNWYQAVRVPGMFGNKRPTLENDTYETQAHKIKQIQSSVITEYTLFTKGVPVNISDKLYYDMGLANEILITDYNLKNNEIFRRLQVGIEAYDDPRYFKNNTKAAHTFTFSNRYLLDKKRIF